MKKPADAIAAYLRAKDGNRPHLLAAAFVEDAMLTMDVQTSGMAFPLVTRGCDAIADVLVRSFAQRYENVYTVCLGQAPGGYCSSFHCDWLVAMTEKDSRAVRVGCGRYDWRFGPATQLVDSLLITIESMQSLPAHMQRPVLDWVAGLPHPWCSASQVLGGAPGLDELSPVFAFIGRERVSLAH